MTGVQTCAIPICGTDGQDTMMVIWHSMSDLVGIYNSNVQLKIIAYELDTDTLQIPDDTS